VSALSLAQCSGSTEQATRLQHDCGIPIRRCTPRSSSTVAIRGRAGGSPDHSRQSGPGTGLDFFGQRTRLSPGHGVRGDHRPGLSPVSRCGEAIADPAGDTRKIRQARQSQVSGSRRVRRDCLRRSPCARRRAWPRSLRGNAGRPSWWPSARLPPAGAPALHLHRGVRRHARR
jgi:hypothetical protein